MEIHLELVREWFPWVGTGEPDRRGLGDVAESIDVDPVLILGARLVECRLEVLECRVFGVVAAIVLAEDLDEVDRRQGDASGVL